MSPTIRTRTSLIGATVIVLSFAVFVSRSSADPCDDARATGPAPDSGWQVQVDPQTGIYSMPAPGTLDATPGRAAAATTGVVVTPGHSAAGGFKATFGDDALVHEKAE